MSARPLEENERFQLTRVQPAPPEWQRPEAWRRIPWPEDGNGDVYDRDRDHATECGECSALVTFGSITNHRNWHERNRNA